jgi:hypothetical protein
MNCEAFERLLDAHGPDALPGDARAHAGGCARCARMLAAAHEVDALLLAPVTTVAPTGFTDRVLARIGTAPVAAPIPTVQPVRIATASDPMPEWIRFVAEPATAGALVVAALVIWQAPRLLTLGRALASAVASRAAAGPAIDPGLWPTALNDDPVRLAFIVAGSSVAPLVAFSLYRWSERLVAGGMRRR